MCKCKRCDCLSNKKQKSSRLEWNKVKPLLKWFWQHTHQNNQNVRISLQTLIECGIFQRQARKERKESRQWGLSAQAVQNEVVAGFYLGASKIPRAMSIFFSLQPLAVTVKLNLSQQNLSLNWTNPWCWFSGWKWCAAGGEKKIKWSLTLVLSVRIQFKGKILLVLCNYGLRTSLFYEWFYFYLEFSGKKFKLSYLYPLPFVSLGTPCFCWAL